MNAVEIEEAISDLAEQEFDAAGFPYAFLEAFGNKATTIKRLKSGSANATDIEGTVLQRSNIHIAVYDEGEVTETLNTLKDSPATTKAKAKFTLVTDGITFEAEDLVSGETVACDYTDFPNHFGFFLPLAGISTVKQIRESSFDIRATSRLNKLYVELLRNRICAKNCHTLWASTVTLRDWQVRCYITLAATWKTLRGLSRSITVDAIAHWQLLRRI